MRRGDLERDILRAESGSDSSMLNSVLGEPRTGESGEAAAVADVFGSVCVSTFLSFFL